MEKKQNERKKNKKAQTNKNHEGVSEIFHRLNSPSRTMTLGSTQPLTEMSARDISSRVKAAGA